MRREFDIWLERPEAYRERALRECAVFPEGRIYPFAIPALGYANLALRDPAQKEHSAAQMRKLVDLLIPIIAQDVGAPDRDLLRLESYDDEGTRLASLNLTLASYERVSDDGRYARLHEHLSALLRAALVQEQGGPIASYPAYTWYFDTVMALASLQLRADHRGGEAEQAATTSLIERHLRWRAEHATDPATGLPIAYPGGPPRGCDVPMQVCLLAHMDRDLARETYGRFVAAHWLDLGLLSGFAEWPIGRPGAGVGDVDSGPVVLGIGATATGLGIGAAQAAGDERIVRKIVGQLDLANGVLRFPVSERWKGEALSWFALGVPVDSRYLSGFLYGDAILFYSLTWAPYPAARPAEHEDDGR